MTFWAGLLPLPFGTRGEGVSCISSLALLRVVRGGSASTPAGGLGVSLLGKLQLRTDSRQELLPAKCLLIYSQRC